MSTRSSDLPNVQIDEKIEKEKQPNAAQDPAQGLRSEWMNEARPGRIAQPVDRTAVAADRPAAAVLEKIKLAYPSEVVVNGEPGEFIKLPGFAQYEVLKDGSTRIGTTQEHVKTPGPHDFITISPKGEISMSSKIGSSNFSVSLNGDRQTITMPNGDTVVVQGGRAVETTTGGRRTELLSPAEAKEREVQRQLEKELEKVVAPIAESIRGGNVPIAEIRQAYQNAASPETLTRMLNDALYNPKAKTEYGVELETSKIGEQTVRVQNRFTGDYTHINIPVKHVKPDVQFDRPNSTYKEDK